jgi:hypothetical protein
MELYDLLEVDPFGRRFANTARVDPIPFAKPEEACDTCYSPCHRRRSGPFTIVWEPGSDVIPDFLFGYHDEFAVTERVKAAFEKAALSGYVAWPLKMMCPPKRASRKLPIVAWPYVGPRFWDIHVTEDVELLREESTVEFNPPCPRCGRQTGQPVGDPKKWRLIVDRKSWNGSDFMNPNGIMPILVTQRVADIILENKFTNVRVRHVGRISD